MRQSVGKRALFAMLPRAAINEQTILLLGECGTGKEVLARAIRERRPRRAGPFVVLDSTVQQSRPTSWSPRSLATSAARSQAQTQRALGCSSRPTAVTVRRRNGVPAPR